MARNFETKEARAEATRLRELLATLTTDLARRRVLDQIAELEGRTHSRLTAEALPPGVFADLVVKAAAQDLPHRPQGGRQRPSLRGELAACVVDQGADVFFGVGHARYMGNGRAIDDARGRLIVFQTAANLSPWYE